MPTITRPHAPRMTAVMRSGETVTPLELAVASLTDGLLQGAPWASGLLIDMGGRARPLAERDRARLVLLPALPMVAGIVLLALGMKKALEAIPALASLGVLAAVLCALIAYEKTQFGELRDRLRNQVETPAHEQSP